MILFTKKPVSIGYCIMLLGSIVFLFSGCELIDQEFKKVPYLLESQKTFQYQSNIVAGGKNTDVRKFNRSDFDIPFLAELKSFKIKSLNVSFTPNTSNACNKMHLRYILSSGSSIGQLTENVQIINRDIDVPQNIFDDIIIEKTFMNDIGKIRTALEKGLKNNLDIFLQYELKCAESSDTNINIKVVMNFAIEYLECEEVLEGSDLEDCQ